MSRALRKGPFIRNLKSNSKQNLILKERSETITPCLVDSSVEVSTGKSFVVLKITQSMVGYKLGEFIPTRHRLEYKKK